MHTRQFVVGQTVAIINRTFAGQFVVEGLAEIVGPSTEGRDRYRVKFLREEGKRGGKYLPGTYSRFIDPEAQSNPRDYAEFLNEQTGRSHPNAPDPEHPVHLSNDTGVDQSP